MIGVKTDDNGFVRSGHRRRLRRINPHRCATEPRHLTKQAIERNGGKADANH